MPSPTEYQRRVTQLDWKGLKELWEGIKQRRTPGWEQGRAFEYLILRAFELDGAKIRWPYEVTLEGEVIEQIDGAVHSAGLHCVVEAKDSARPVNVGPIAKLGTQLTRRPGAAVGLLFSRSGFTKSAVFLARFLAPRTILLWTGQEVDFLLRQRSFNGALLAKYRRCVEEADPIYDFRGEAVQWLDTS